MDSKPKFGTVGWMDLTVPDAITVRDFYASVVGWKTSAVPMGDYADFCMHPEEGSTPVAGGCHARGVNEGLPAQWLMYVSVPDLAESLAHVERLGGKVLRPAKKAGGYGTIAVIQDPAGAVLALIQPE
jgi:uncharacterized protein